MRNPKYYIAIDEYERRIIMGSLNNLRNKLIADGRYTDAVDDVLVNAIDAPIKKFKVRITEGRLWRKQYLSKWAGLTTRKMGKAFGFAHFSVAEIITFIYMLYLIKVMTLLYTVFVPLSQGGVAGCHEKRI